MFLIRAMAKIKWTKGELKRQRDALKQYERYLPTLQLKKQQLQMEISHQLSLIEEKRHNEQKKIHSAQIWAGLLSDPEINIGNWLKSKQVFTSRKNIAGVDLPWFEKAEFEPVEYDLFIVPLWVDAAIEQLKAVLSLRMEIGILEQGLKVLRDELRITTQRVNLFEKVKIPEAEEAIRMIKIFIGDQMTNAVGRSKIAKRKIQELEEAVL